MNRFAGLAMVLVFVSGCATASKGSATQQDPGVAKENALKQAYKSCIAKEGKTSANCNKIKDQLYEQMEWDLLDEAS